MLSMELLLERFLKTAFFRSMYFGTWETSLFYCTHSCYKIYIYVCVYNVQKKNKFSLFKSDSLVQLFMKLCVFKNLHIYSINSIFCFSKISRYFFVPKCSIHFHSVFTFLEVTWEIFLPKSCFVKIVITGDANKSKLILTCLFFKCRSHWLFSRERKK